ncbi:MAG: hypothetical protein GYB53_23865 [Rhodobacteraceae bacterium]|nr:hypothetical protein [Paracoccaceae bacterium]MBR9823699.1 hypothetical protein [Paracoccaceae bacterium]
MRDHAPQPESHQLPRHGAGRHLPHGAGMILAVIGWGLLLIGIVSGILIERWVL